LAGSYYVEHLTDTLERHAMELLVRVDELGGAARAIGASFFQEEIARSAYEYQLRVERGDAVIVGVNKFADGQEPPVIATPDYSALERDQVERVRGVRQKRDGERAAAALPRCANRADVRCGRCHASAADGADCRRGSGARQRR
jgi:methylmalonyl-CoA mutase N-terminal domain/subunit